MRRSDVVELGLIAAAAVAVALARGLLPARLPAGEIALTASALLLGQGLIRDLVIKYRRRRNGGAACSLEPGKNGACLCMESTLGIFGILAGAGVLLGGVRTTISLPPWFWPVLVLVVGGFGFGLKNLVIDWKARRIRIERHHENVRF